MRKEYEKGKRDLAWDIEPDFLAQPIIEEPGNTYMIHIRTVRLIKDTFLYVFDVFDHGLG